MALVSVRAVNHNFGGPELLQEVDLQIEKGERICLLGRNGTGKSTLIKLIAGEIRPDVGQVTHQQGASIARLPQRVPQHLDGNAFEVTTKGLGPRADLLAAYHRASLRVAQDASPAALEALDRLHHQLDLEDAWQLHQEVERVLSHLGVDPDAEFSSLSGGTKRRVLLARSLVSRPDLLLLDEPTNHLDIPSIEWLEEYLLSHVETLLFVTHDRSLVRKLATRVVELDRAQLYNWNCDYDTFLLRKQDALSQEGREWEEFDKKLAQEERWVRQGTQARVKRNMGRVKALQNMRDQRANRREREGSVRMHVQSAERTGKLVIEAENIRFSYDDQLVVDGCTVTVQRGDKVGIIGPNGSGKTTLLRLLLGELPPQSGTLEHGTHLQIAYFDQMRDQLDPAGTVQDNVNDGNPTLTIDGRARHVAGYMRDFLFPPERLQSRVRDLSGGERTRLMLARLFCRPFNVLVMDEPTNDLDLESLELLERLLIDYAGTLLLVSHDRTLLNNVVSKTLAIEEEGKVRAYAGGYDDWLWQRPQKEEETSPQQAAPKAKPAPEAPRPRKISFNERQELAEIPQRIEALENEQTELYATMSDPQLYQENGAQVAQIQARLEALGTELEIAYARWEELDALPED